MKKYILTTVIALSCITIASAQDDMYFGSSKKQKSVSIDALTKANNSRQGSRSAYTPPSTSADDSFNPSDYCGSMRSVDEYNRRDRFCKDYTADTDPLEVPSESILVSKEDYECVMKMKKYDGYNNVTLVINNDPWYYDSFYYPWYRYNYYSSLWYDPWYYRPGIHVGWGIGYRGWSIGWGYTWGGYWSRPYYAHHGYYGHGIVRTTYHPRDSWSNRRYTSGTTYRGRTVAGGVVRENMTYRNQATSRNSFRGNYGTATTESRTGRTYGMNPANRSVTTSSNSSSSFNRSNFSGSSRSFGSSGGGVSRGGSSFNGGGGRSFGGGGGGPARGGSGAR